MADYSRMSESQLDAAAAKLAERRAALKEESAEMEAARQGHLRAARAEQVARQIEGLPDEVIDAIVRSRSAAAASGAHNPNGGA